METIPVISLGAAAFWIALAAVLIANGINGVRREKLRQETLLKLVEKTGQLDEQTVKTLFPAQAPSAPHVFGPPPRQPDGRRGVKIFGTIVLSIAAGLAIFITILWQFGPPQIKDDPLIPVVPYARGDPPYVLRYRFVRGGAFRASACRGVRSRGCTSWKVGYRPPISSRRPILRLGAP